MSAICKEVCPILLLFKKGILQFMVVLWASNGYPTELSEVMSFRN